MLTAAREIRGLCAGLDCAGFEQSRIHQVGRFHLFTVIGEAARRVSDATRAAHATLPWRDMIGMRNRLVHEYDQIDIDLTWDTIERDVPMLIVALEVILAKMDSDEAEE